MGTRNRQSPRQKRQVYLTAEIAQAFDAAVLASGLSVGQFIDRWWLSNPPIEVGGVVHPPTRQATATKAGMIPAAPTTKCRHTPENKGWGTICSTCLVVKGPLGWPE